MFLKYSRGNFRIPKFCVSVSLRHLKIHFGIVDDHKDAWLAQGLTSFFIAQCSLVLKFCVTVSFRNLIESFCYMQKYYLNIYHVCSFENVSENL